MDMKETYYEVLGLPKMGVDQNGVRISTEQIKNNYTILKKAMPPILMPKIEQAYKILSNETERKKYDEKLSESLSKQKDDGVKNDSMPEDKEAGRYDIKRQNTINRWKKIGVIAGSLVFAGPLGVVVACAVMKKRGSFKIQKVPKSSTIVDVETKETQEIKEENEAFNKEIEKILKSNSNNYELEIAVARYKNKINILNKRIEFNENKKNMIGTTAISRLEALGLKIKCLVMSLNLEIQSQHANLFYRKLNNYKTKNTDKLADINQEIKDVQKEINKNPKKMGLKYKFRSLNQKRLREMEKVSLKRKTNKQLLYAFFNYKSEENAKTR